MNLKINKKIRQNLISLAIILGLALNMAVFVNAETSFAQQVCKDGQECTETEVTKLKTLEDKTSATPSGEEELKPATVPYPYVANPNTSHSFNVDKYLTISNEHGAYLENGNQSSVVNFIIRIINIMVRVIGSVAMLILIIGGLILITAHGNEQQLEKGKDTVKYGLIGLAVGLSASLIIAFVNYFLSVGSS